jgi:Domain of unknown function (DUF4173)
MFSNTGLRGNRSFLAKLGGAAALVALADVTLWDSGPGSALGLFALGWIAVMAAVSPSIIRDRRSLAALSAATVMAIIALYDPGVLGWLCFWLALTIAAFLPRLARFGDAWSWTKRINYHLFVSPFAPLFDRIRVSRVKRRVKGPSLLGFVPALILPAIGGGIFLLLFAIANPIISTWLESFHIAGPDGKTILRSAFWGAMAIGIWASLRPRRTRYGFTPMGDGDGTAIPGVSTASVTLSLILFNLMFAGQNALDIAFLWSGARLPEGMTLAGYAHSGAYPLIVTALLAGLFVIIATRKGTPMADNPLIKGLVLVWVAQNVFLVASSIERLMKYIDAYALTELRIAALLWMALVALGLILIAVRMMGGKSLSWLINACTGAALALVAGTSVFDLDEVAARWNVRNMDGAAGLDLCYLHDQGESALLPLIALEAKLDATDSRRRTVTELRQVAETKVRNSQAHWQSWTIRNARRLAQIPADLVMVERLYLTEGRCYQGDDLFGPRYNAPEPAADAPPLTPAPQSKAPLTKGR